MDARRLNVRGWARRREFIIGIGLLLLGALARALLSVASKGIHPAREFYRIFGPGISACIFISGVVVICLSLTKIGTSPKGMTRLGKAMWFGIAMSILGLVPISLMLTYSALTGHIFSEGDGLLAVALAILVGMPGLACALIAALFRGRGRTLAQLPESHEAERG